MSGHGKNIPRAVPFRKGQKWLLHTIGKLRRQINPKLKIAGAVLTMVDQRINYARAVSDLLHQTYGGKIKSFSTAIPHSVGAAGNGADHFARRAVSLFVPSLQGQG